MSTLKKIETQTKVKHEILRDYLRHWGYIITGGLQGLYQTQNDASKNWITRFVYVDLFSFEGVYDDDGSLCYGSPVIGIESLDKLQSHFEGVNGIKPEIITILIEEKRSRYERLLETLRQKGYGDRILETTDLYRIPSGKIVVINADYQKYLDDLLEFTQQKYTWSFYFIDPFGPMAIPLAAVSRIISQPKVDSIINFPYQDLHKKTGSAVRDNPEPSHIPLMEYYDAMYNTQAWRSIAQQYYEQKITKDKMEKYLVELYYQRLKASDPDVVIKTIPLKFSDKERTMFYLFLTTHDGTGALKMNEILDDARVKEYDHREDVRTKKTGQPTLFDIGRPDKEEANLDALADLIYQHCKQENIQFKELLARLANTPYYLDDVKKAMTKLKSAGKASYRKLSHKEWINFK